MTDMEDLTDGLGAITAMIGEVLSQRHSIWQTVP